MQIFRDMQKYMDWTFELARKVQFIYFYRQEFHMSKRK